jgi:type I restriction enzyme M protein
VFVNWWQQIRYDLKTVVSTGWHHALIPDSYLIAEFFKKEADTIELLEAKLAETQSELAEAVENAQEVTAYEPDEDETVTAAVIKKALKELIDDLRGTAGVSAQNELKKLQAEEEAIAVLEKRQFVGEFLEFCFCRLNTRPLFLRGLSVSGRLKVSPVYTTPIRLMISL